MEPILLRADRAGERADQLLARLVPELTRSAAQRLLEAGAVTLGGRPVKKNDKAAAGDVLEVRLPEPEPVDVLPQAIPLDVAYEDADVIVVNKPVGLVVHPAAGHPDGTLVNALLYHCGESLSGINGALRPGIVHRIDRDTSGLLIAAKNDFAHQALAAQLQDHSLYREYEAVCVGGLREDGGTVDAPIGRHPTDRKTVGPCRGYGPCFCRRSVLLLKYILSSSDDIFIDCGRCWSASPAIPIFSAVWRPAAPTRSGCIWPPSATPCWGTWYTGPRSPSPAWRASAFTPEGSPLSTPAPGSGSRSSAPCPPILPRC